jgi:hypothetical protein
VQFKGEIRRLSGDEEAAMRARYVNRFPVARMLRAPVWEIRPDELKFTDNTLGSAASYTGSVTRIARKASHGRAESDISCILLLPRHPLLKG